MSSVIDTIHKLLDSRPQDDPTVVVRLDDQSVDRLLHLLCDTRDDELSCEEVFVRLDEYVDCLVTHQFDRNNLALVEHHLALCADCRDELTALQKALAEAGAGLD